MGLCYSMFFTVPLHIPHHHHRAARAVSLHQSIKTGRFSLRNLSKQRTLRRAASKNGAAPGSARSLPAPQTAKDDTTPGNARSLPVTLAQRNSDLTSEQPSAEVLPSDGTPDLEAGMAINGGNANCQMPNNHEDSDGTPETSPFSFSKAPSRDTLQRTGAEPIGLLRQQTLPSQLRINNGIERKSMLARYDASPCGRRVHAAKQCCVLQKSLRLLVSALSVHGVFVQVCCLY